MSVDLVWLYLGRYVGVKYTQEYYVCVGYTYNLQVRVEYMQEYYAYEVQKVMYDVQELKKVEKFLLSDL